MKLLIINGPNINMLGIREKNIYGNETYEDLKKFINDICLSENINVKIFQSNHEGAIIDEIQNAYNEFDLILINPAAYTHTSIGILDALKAVNIPFVEVHLSNTSKREDYRKISYISPYALKTIKGKGFNGYKEGILYLKEYYLKAE